MYSIGIDIGSFSVKVAKVRSNNRGYELIHYSEFPLSQDPTKDNKIEMVEIFNDIKARLFEEGTQLVVGAHLFEVAWRRKEFPFRERHKILKSLPFELEDDVPFSNENTVYDAKVTHYTGNKANVIAVACPRDHLEQIIKNFSDAHVEPTIVSVDGIAFTNVLEAWRDAPWEYPAVKETPVAEGELEKAPVLPVSEVDIALNIGHRTTCVAIIKDGFTLDVRLIDWGGKDIADLIAQRYSMHPLEALKDLRKRAFILTNNEGATRDQVALSEVVKTSVDVLIQKLSLALLELRTLYNLQYRQAILTGGVSQMKNLGPYLTQKLECTTNRLAHLDMLPQIDFAASPNSELAGVTAIGLAIEGVKRPKNPPLNLLKGDFAKQSQSLRLFWEKWSYSIKVAATAFVLLLVWGAVRDNFSGSNADTARDQLRKVGKDIMGVKGDKVERAARGYIKEQEQKMKLKEMVDGLQNINSALDALKKISALAPSRNLGNINIYDFSVNAETVSISGEASKVEVLNEINKALKSAAKNNQVTVGQAPGAVHSGYKGFNYSFQIERKTGGTP
jgi:general secretion pathway protein L